MSVDGRGTREAGWGDLHTAVPVGCSVAFLHLLHSFELDCRYKVAKKEKKNSRIQVRTRNWTLETFPKPFACEAKIVIQHTAVTNLQLHHGPCGQISNSDPPPSTHKRLSFTRAECE